MSYFLKAEKYLISLQVTNWMLNFYFFTFQLLTQS